MKMVKMEKHYGLNNYLFKVEDSAPLVVAFFKRYHFYGIFRLNIFLNNIFIVAQHQPRRFTYITKFRYI